MKETIKDLAPYLPKGWEEKSKELGALVRAREIKTAEELLELNLLYLTVGGSFGATATLLNIATDTSMTKKAVYTRIQKSANWLKWMTEEMCRKNQYTIEPPKWLDRNVVAVDASDLTAKGSQQANYRLHCAFELFRFNCRTLEITNIQQGEKLSRHVIEKGDVVLADRIYGTINGMEHVRENGGDFLLRYRTKGFKIFDEAGKLIDISTYFTDLKPMENTSFDGYYVSKGKRRPLRIVIMKKDNNAAEKAQRKMLRKMNKQRHSVPSAMALDYNNYIILATSLDYTNEQILELYRGRWQIEQVFYRLKSMYHLGDIPSKNDATVQAWFYGKLFVATLAEVMLKQECFSPWE